MSRDDGEWMVDHGSEVAEVGTGYAGSEAAGNTAFPQQDEIEGGFQNVRGPIVPESYEEQMMLAMTVSLAEARARASSPEVACHLSLPVKKVLRFSHSLPYPIEM
ncbi:hypothetical protein LguiB_012855 [Lonicera macranthoides]